MITFHEAPILDHKAKRLCATVLDILCSVTSADSTVIMNLLYERLWE